MLTDFEPEAIQRRVERHCTGSRCLALREVTQCFLTFLNLDR
jgi:hypothetical protein